MSADTGQNIVEIEGNILVSRHKVLRQTIYHHMHQMSLSRGSCLEETGQAAQYRISLGKPFHTIHIDNFHPFVRSKSGNANILVAVDRFMNFMLLRAVQNRSAVLAAQFLHDVASIYGPPTMTPNCMSTFMSTKFKAFRIKHV